MSQQLNTDIIKRFEGCKLKAYLCPAKVWTIGYGSTRHPNGAAVKQGDTITQQQAEEYLQIEVQRREAQMKLPATLSANQRSALVSFQYNVGQAAWHGSTLRRKVLANPNDPSIRAEFGKWVRAGGKMLTGLVRRREAEANLYFTP